MKSANEIEATTAKDTKDSSILTRTIRIIKERWKLMKANVTVEPILACYTLSCVFSSLACQNLHLEKACRVNLNFSEEVCDALYRRAVQNYTKEEEAVQMLTASVQGWRNIVQTALPSVMILFVGSWSDKTGRRKACVLTPLVGEFFSTGGFLLYRYFFYEIALEWSLVLEMFLAVTGGWFVMGIGVFSYIGDITTEETRTFRVGVANLCSTLGIPLGTALSGVMLRIIGYYGVFLISAILLFATFLYGYIYLKDPEISKEKRKAKIGGAWGLVSSVFAPAHVRETFTVVFRRGADNRRLRVTLLVVVVCVVFGPLYGEMCVMYLFARFRFNWDEVQFSLFSTYGVVTHLLGTMFSISVFSNVMKLDDSIVGIISSMSKILSSFVYAFAATTLEIYIAPLVEIFNGTSFIAMRSIASKLVSSEELGKVNSLFGLAEAVMPLVYGPLYARMYMATMSVLPGAVFLLGGAMTFPAVVIFGWFYFQHKKDFAKKNLNSAPCA